MVMRPEYLYPTDMAENCTCRWDLSPVAFMNGTGGGPLHTQFYVRQGGICGNCLRLTQLSTESRSGTRERFEDWRT